EERETVQRLDRAAERATALTQQLLAFSRRQVLQPRPLDLNECVADMEEMLRRLIGEDVELTVDLEPGLGPVLADPTQIEQVIVNLAVNARDAMPDGGRLTISTQSADSECVLAVSDTGVGITQADRDRIFEPFFT